MTGKKQVRGRRAKTQVGQNGKSRQPETLRGGAREKGIREIGERGKESNVAINSGHDNEQERTREGRRARVGKSRLRSGEKEGIKGNRG